MVLLLWLFALGLGLANACLIQTDKSQAYGHGSLGMHSPTAALGHAISVARVDTIRDQDSELGRSKSPCLKICNDGSQSLPKQRVSFDLTHLVLVPLPAVGWTTATPVVSARGLAVVQRPPDPECPIRTTLSRLAL